MHFRLEVALTAPLMGLLDFKPCIPKSLFMALLVGGGGLAVNQSRGPDSGNTQRRNSVPEHQSTERPRVSKAMVFNGWKLEWPPPPSFSKRTHILAAERLSEPLRQTIASMELLSRKSTQGLATMDRNGVVKKF